jgi:formate transporter
MTHGARHRLRHSKATVTAHDPLNRTALLCTAYKLDGLAYKTAQIQQEGLRRAAVGFSIVLNSIEKYLRRGLAHGLNRDCHRSSTLTMIVCPPMGEHPKSRSGMHRCSGPASKLILRRLRNRIGPHRTHERQTMDYVKPADVISTMIETGNAKLRLAPRDLLIRGAIAGGILGISTSLAFSGALSTGQPIVGALIFPVGLVMIVLLGLELVTGSFGLLPLAWIEKDASFGRVISNWSWVFRGNLLGSVAYGILLAIALTNMGASEPSGVPARIVAIAEAKTIGYAAFGFAGMVTVFVKAILCNWMVCLAVILALTTTATVGKIAAAWLPVFIFFAQGFEHSVVNMFVIPTGMLMGAKVSVTQWWFWNQIPVTLGNLVGGFVFTGLGLYLTYKPASVVRPVIAPVAVQVAAE